jgi:hypothetical protein
VSNIIEDIVRTVPGLGRTLDLDEDERNPMFILGLLWEDAGYTHLGWKQLSVSCEGIVCTADCIDPVAERVEEFKLTWRSLRNWYIEDNFRWLTQVKAYCYAWRLSRAVFHVFHVNGNYQPPQPVVKDYEVEFSQQEIAENWAMLQTHKRYMEERQKN